MSDDPVLLPTSSNAATSSENITSVPCGVCRRQFSKYTCPKCNLPYCSLSCFRSSAHTECSESFYRKELETDIRTVPSKNVEERREMMELLKRFEESARDEELEFLAEDDDTEDEDDLNSRLAALDLEKASYDEIWAALTPAEREKFLNAVIDPKSELAKQLLSSEELEKQIKAPWWDRPHKPAEQGRMLSKLHNYGRKPDIIDIPVSAVKAVEAAGVDGPSLLYNICAVFVAYAFVTRYLSTSPLTDILSDDSDREEACKSFSRLVPFLVDRKSKFVIHSLSGLITDLWSRFESGSMTPIFFSLLMRDTAKLLRPAAIASLPSGPDTSSSATEKYTTHPTVDALRALSDISALFQHTGPALKGRVVNPVSAKLAFYAARIVVTPTSTLTALAEEVLARARLIEQEGDLAGSLPGPQDTQQVAPPLNENISKDEKRPKIEELT